MCSLQCLARKAGERPANQQRRKRRHAPHAYRWCDLRHHRLGRLGDLGGGALPGDTIELTVGAGAPVALHAGLGFAIREGGRAVGAGTVLARLD